MPSIHAVVPRQLSSTWSLVTAGRGSSIDGSALDDAPSPGTGVWDAGAVSAGAVPTVGTATSDVASDLFSAFGRRLRLPATTRRGARETTARAARDAPRKDAIGVVGWRRASVVIVAGRLLKCALSSRRVHGKFTRDSEKTVWGQHPFRAPLRVEHHHTEERGGVGGQRRARGSTEQRPQKARGCRSGRGAGTRNPARGGDSPYGIRTVFPPLPKGRFDGTPGGGEAAARVHPSDARWVTYITTPLQP